MPSYAHTRYVHIPWLATFLYSAPCVVPQLEEYSVRAVTRADVISMETPASPQINYTVGQRSESYWISERWRKPYCCYGNCNGFEMVFMNILVCLALVQIISLTYGFSGEMLPYSDPNTCADNEYFDSRLFKCIPCSDLKNLEPTKDSGLLNKIIILTNSYNRNAHIEWTYLFQSCHALVTCRVRLCIWIAVSFQSVNCVQTIKCQQQINLTVFHVQLRLSTEMILWFVQHAEFRRYMV
jgi:hypothetical protein